MFGGTAGLFVGASQLAYKYAELPNYAGGNSWQWVGAETTSQRTRRRRHSTV